MLFDFNALRLSVCAVCAERKKTPTDSGRGLAVMHHQSACLTSQMAALVFGRRSLLNDGLFRVVGDHCFAASSRQDGKQA